MDEKLFARVDQLERKLLEPQRQHLSALNEKFDSIKEAMIHIKTVSDAILGIANSSNSDKHSGYPSPSGRPTEDHRNPINGNAHGTVFKPPIP